MTATSPQTGPGALTLVGISYKTAPVHLLERLALSPDEVRAVLTGLGDSGTVRDALALSTCNRTEFYLLPATDISDPGQVTEVVKKAIGDERFPAEDRLYFRQGREAVAHLFRVACGLDSMILGEAQILGQVKDAYEVAADVREPSRHFENVLQATLRVAKRVRAETEIGIGAVSVASAAVHLANRIYADLSGKTVVVVGAGETGRLAAQHFDSHRPHRLLVLNRTLARARELVSDLEGAEAMELGRLGEALSLADIVVSAVRSETPIITQRDIASIVHGRSGQPLLLLDLGMPRNIDAAVNQLPNVFLHDMDALKQVVDTNLARRHKEIPKVESLIAQEVERLFAHERVDEIGSVIAEIRRATDTLRMDEVEQAKHDLGEQAAQAVDVATRALINKLLHGPVTTLKRLARQGTPEAGDKIALIREMFRHIQGDGDRR